MFYLNDTAAAHVIEVVVGMLKIDLIDQVRKCKYISFLSERWQHCDSINYLFFMTEQGKSEKKVSKHLSHSDLLLLKALKRPQKLPFVR